MLSMVIACNQFNGIKQYSSIRILALISSIHFQITSTIFATVEVCCFSVYRDKADQNLNPVSRTH